MTPQNAHVQDMGQLVEQCIQAAETGQPLPPIDFSNTAAEERWPEVPPPIPEHPKLGHPVKIYHYYDHCTRWVGATCRFAGGQKRPVRLTSCGRVVYKGIKHPRPLYGLHKLSEFPCRPVLMVEGEKAADAAQELLPDWNVLTWAMGAGGVRYSDWRPLRALAVPVVVWPDNDPAGLVAAETVTQLLGRGVVVPPPLEATDGWDLADALEAGWDTRRTLEHIHNSIWARSPVFWGAGGFDPDFFEQADADFPIEELPAALREICQEIATVKGVPAEIAAMACLGVVSGALGKGLRMRAGALEYTPNLYLLCAAQSGRGKSSAAKPAVQPFYDLAAHAREACSARVARARAQVKLLEKQLTAELRKAEPDAARLAELERQLEVEREAQEPRQILVEDLTPEALFQVMRRNEGTAFCYSADAANVVANLTGWDSRRDHNVNSIFLKGFNLEDTVQDRIGRGHGHVSEPCLSMLLMMTPDVMRRILDKPHFSEGGFLARCLVCFSDGEPVSPFAATRQLAPEILDQHKIVVETLYRNFHGQSPRFLTLEEEGVRLLERCWQSQRHAILPPELVSRKAELAGRLALLIHAVECLVPPYEGAMLRPLHPPVRNVPVVAAATVRRAIRIVEWCFRSMARLYAACDFRKTESTRDRVAAILRAKGETTPDGAHQMSLRTLERSHNLSVETIDKLVENCADFELRTIQKPGGGRPAKVLALRSPLTIILERVDRKAALKDFEELDPGNDEEENY